MPNNPNYILTTASLKEKYEELNSAVTTTTGTYEGLTLDAINDAYIALSNNDNQVSWYRHSDPWSRPTTDLIRLILGIRRIRINPYASYYYQP